MNTQDKMQRKELITAQPFRLELFPSVICTRVWSWGQKEKAVEHTVEKIKVKRHEVGKKKHVGVSV